MNAQRPLPVKAAVGLILVGHVAGLLFTRVGMWEKPGFYLVLAFFAAILFLKVWSVYTRRNWGRWLNIAFFTFGLIGMPQTMKKSSEWDVWLLGIQTFLILLAIILLFIPESNRWFRREPPQVPPGC